MAFRLWDLNDTSVNLASARYAPSGGYHSHQWKLARGRLPRFETGDLRYAWLNQSLFVAEGRFGPGSMVEYKVYRVV